MKPKNRNNKKLNRSITIVEKNDESNSSKKKVSSIYFNTNGTGREKKTMCSTKDDYSFFFGALLSVFRQANKTDRRMFYEYLRDKVYKDTVIANAAAAEGFLKGLIDKVGYKNTSEIKPVELEKKIFEEKTEFVVDFENKTKLGKFGEVTDLYDENGTVLKVGDVVLFCDKSDNIHKYGVVLGLNGYYYVDQYYETLRFNGSPSSYIFRDKNIRSKIYKINFVGLTVKDDLVSRFLLKNYSVIPQTEMKYLYITKPRKDVK